MRLRYVELRNYRRFRHAIVELGDGVTGILGQNGVGKSTLVEAVAWALFGNESSIVRTTKEGVRSASAGVNEECSVTLEFDLEADRYRLTRSLKGKDSKADATLLVNDMLVARTDKAVTEAMESRLGMDHKSFFVSVFARQKDLNALSNLRPAQRRELILRMLGIETLDTVITEISSDLRSCRDGLEAMSANLTAPDGKDRREMMRRHLAELKSMRTKLTNDIETAQAELGPISDEVERARMEMEKAEGRSKANAALMTKMATLTADARSKKARSQKIESELSLLEARKTDLPSLEGRVAGLGPLREERERLEELKVRKQELDSLTSNLNQRTVRFTETQAELEAKRNELEALGDPSPMIASLEEALATNQGTMEEARDRLARNQAEQRRYLEESEHRSSKRREIAELGPDSSCPTCERRLDDHYRALLEKMDAEVAESDGKAQAANSRIDEALKGLDRLSKGRVGLEARLKEAQRQRDMALMLRSSLETLEKNLSKMRSEIASLEERRSALGEVDLDPSRLSTVRSKLEGLQRDENALTKLRTELARMEGLEKERAQLKKDLDAITSEEGRSRSELTALAFREEELKEGRERYVLWRDRKESVQRSIQISLSERSRVEGEEKAATTHLEELERNHAQAERKRAELLELNVLQGAMREFRANIVTRVVPSISQMASELFVELTDGKYGGMRLDEEYDVHIMDQGHEYPLDRFSGGESDLASLSLRLAISRMIGERSGHHVNLLVLDEIFGSQDQGRKRNVLELLSSLQRQFGQILVITHIEDIKEALGNSIVVEEGEDGNSKIVAG